MSCDYTAVQSVSTWWSLLSLWVTELLASTLRPQQDPGRPLSETVQAVQTTSRLRQGSSRPRRRAMLGVDNRYFLESVSLVSRTVDETIYVNSLSCFLIRVTHRHYVYVCCFISKSCFHL